MCMYHISDFNSGSDENLNQNCDDDINSPTEPE